MSPTPRWKRALSFVLCRGRSPQPPPPPLPDDDNDDVEKPAQATPRPLTATNISSARPSTWHSQTTPQYVAIIPITNPAALAVPFRIVPYHDRSNRNSSATDVFYDALESQPPTPTASNRTPTPSALVDRPLPPLPEVTVTPPTAIEPERSPPFQFPAPVVQRPDVSPSPSPSPPLPLPAPRPTPPARTPAFFAPSIPATPRAGPSRASTPAPSSFARPARVSIAPSADNQRIEFPREFPDSPLHPVTITRAVDAVTTTTRAATQIAPSVHSIESTMTAVSMRQQVQRPPLLPPPEHSQNKLKALFQRRRGVSEPLLRQGARVRTASATDKGLKPNGGGEPPARPDDNRITTFLTLLTIAEKALEGVSCWGPKAVVSVFAEGLRLLQLQVNNDNAVRDSHESVQRIVADLTTPSDPNAVIPPELIKREEAFTTKMGMILRKIEKYKKETMLADMKGEGIMVQIKWWLDASKKALVAAKVAQELGEINREIVLELQVFLAGNQVDLAVKVHKIMNQQEKQMLEQSKANERDLLSRLNPVRTAFHDDAKHAPLCLTGTRSDLLADISSWFHDPAQPRVYCLTGYSGTGKTAIAQSVCDMFATTDLLGAAFFASRAETARRRPSAVLPTLVYQLASTRPVLRKWICAAIEACLDVATKAPHTQIERLVRPSLRVAEDGQAPAPFLIVVDALDECERETSEEDARLLSVLVRCLLASPLPVKLFITSSSRSLVAQVPSTARPPMGLPSSLTKISILVVREDIVRYLRDRFDKIRQAFPRLAAAHWPPDRDVQALARQAGYLFIYAFVAMNYIAVASPQKRLRTVLGAGASDNVFAALDSLNLLILQEIVAGLDEGSAAEFLRMFHRVVGAVVFAQEPLSLAALSELLGEEVDDIRDFMHSLDALVEIDEDVHEPIRIFHSSLVDMLTDPKRCKDERFLLTAEAAHLEFARLCVNLANMRLKRDMCNIGDYGLLNAEVPNLDVRIGFAYPYALRYACRYWTVHVVEVKSPSQELLDGLQMFCSEHLLHWLEALSLLRQLHPVADTLTAVIDWLDRNTWLSNNGEVGTTPLFKDLKETVQQYGDAIEASALQVYHSVAVLAPQSPLFDPTTSPRSTFSGWAKLVSPRLTSWRAGSVPLPEEDMERTTPVAFSLDGARYVAPSREDYALRVYDAQSGAEQLRLVGHRFPVISVAFSPDGTRIVSGSRDRTVRVWDARTGAQLVAFRGHRKRVTSVAFSRDSTLVASGGGNDDGTVHVWDVGQRTLVGRAGGHRKRITTLSFSRDGARVLSGSEDGTTRSWSVPVPGKSAVGEFGELTQEPEQEDEEGMQMSAPRAEHKTGQPGFWFDDATGWLWCSEDGEASARLCWVPDDLRPGPTGLASYGTKVAFGSLRGLSTVLDFASHPHFSGGGGVAVA